MTAPGTETGEEPSRLDAWLGHIAGGLAVAFSLYSIAFGQFFNNNQLAYLDGHLAFGLVVSFLFVACRRARGKGLAVALAALSLIPTAYVYLNLDALIERVSDPTSADFWVGLILIVLVLEGARVTFVWIVPLLSLVMMAFALAGPVFPEPFYHRGFDLVRLVARLTTDLGGIYGTLLDISASFVVIFLIFGAMLEASGAARFFVDLPMAVFARRRAGPALSAVSSSALIGTVSGSAAANVITTGTFTIPLMKGAGLRPHQAAAVEAAASSGGQIMPPVMGTATFIMARLTGIPYVTIIGAALIPALLYFLSVGFSVWFVSRKEGPREPRERAAKGEVARLVREGWHHFIPLAVLVGLLWQGYSPPFSGFYAIVTVLAVGALQPRRRRLRWRMVLDGLRRGGRTAAEFAVLLACVQIVVDLLSGTGVGVKLSRLIVLFSGGDMLAGLFLAAFAALLLGMGLPSVGAYILLSILGAPALTGLGVPLLPAHLFIFYFCILSALSPPIAMASLMASKLAGASYVRTSLTALRYALPAFVIPFLFIYQPLLLMRGPAGEMVAVALIALGGFVALAAGLQGSLVRPLTAGQRALLLTAAALLFVAVLYPGWLWALSGAAALGAAVRWNAGAGLAAGECGLRAAWEPPEGLS